MAIFVGERTEPIKPLKPKRQWLKFAMAAAALFVGNTLLSDGALRESWFAWHRCGVDAWWWILYYTAQQIVHHKETACDHRGFIAAAREYAALCE